MKIKDLQYMLELIGEKIQKSPTGLNFKIDVRIDIDYEKDDAHVELFIDEGKEITREHLKFLYDVLGNSDFEITTLYHSSRLRVVVK